MRMTYDPEADALMLRLSDSPVETSEEVAPNVVLDFDGEGRVVGIEVLFVSELPDANPMELAFKVYRERAEKAA
ncbi:MAG: DUF2283 domain-containing protein [Geminicoccaceae bacterium]